MIAMIFEVWPKSEHRQDYLETAAVLRPLLDGIEGFISIERFESLSEPSAANPKFASYRGTGVCELRVQKRH